MRSRGIAPSFKIAKRLAAIGLFLGSLGVPITASAAAAVPTLAAPLPALTITPKFDLRDGQTVTVTGSNFPAATYNGPVYVLECSGLDTNACDVASIDLATIDGTGAFTLSFTILAGTDFTARGSQTCDPGAQDCIIRGIAEPAGTNLGEEAAAGFTLANTEAHTKVKTATWAKASTRSTRTGAEFQVTGTVKAGRKGVPGINVEVFKKGRKLTQVGAATTTSGGRFTVEMTGGKRTATYVAKARWTTIGNKAYRPSASKPITVRHRG